VKKTIGTALVRSMMALLAASLLQNAWSQTIALPPAKKHPLTRTEPDPKWEEEHAYTLGVQAYVFAFPYVFNDVTRYRWAARGVPNVSATGEADAEVGKVIPNRLSHQRKVSRADYREGGRPNNDTLYSGGWFDVGTEPLILTLPDFGDRYYNVQLCDFDADNFDYIGTRTHGGKGGTYAIIGPNWKGELPPGVKAVKPANTNWILVLMRVLVNRDDADVKMVNKLQDQVRVVPLSQYLGKSTGPRLYEPQSPLISLFDSLSDFKWINRVLTESPPPAREAQLVKMFAQIGVGPGQDVEKMSDAVKRGLARAATAGRMIVTSGPYYQVGRVMHDGWGLTPKNWGRLGVDGDYMVRSAKSLGGFVTHDPEENVYPAVLQDTNGELLSDERKYQLKFAKGQLPPVNAFWSITLYDSTFNMAINPYNIHSLGDRDKGMKLDADGGLTIHIQKDPPSEDKRGNWLPAAGGNFHLVLRAYMPKADILEGKWLPPGVKRVD
jgi:hypothetical protein